MKLGLPKFFKKKPGKSPKPAKSPPKVVVAPPVAPPIVPPVKPTPIALPKAPPKKSAGSGTRDMNAFFDFFSNRKRGGSLWWVFLAILLYLSDLFITGFNGFNFNGFLNVFSRVSFESITGVFLNVGIIAIMVAYMGFKKPEPREAISFFIFVELIWLILSMNGLSFNLGVVLHATFAIVVLIFLLYPAMEDKVQANFLIGLCVFIDFFLFSIIAESNISLPYFNRLIIPIWFFLALAFSGESKTKSVLVFVVIMFYVFNASVVVAEFNRVGVASLTQEDKTLALKFVQDTWDNFLQSTTAYAKKTANDTLGEYYTGEINSKASLKLGVSLADVKTADTKFYEDQPVSVWATVVGQTIDEPVGVEISCTVDGKKIEGVEVDPVEMFFIESFDERGVECSFEPGLLKEGYREISLNAKFNFLTSAYIKTYFMNQERIDTLRKEKIDPLKDVESDPVVVYTDGPIMLGLDVGRPPLDNNEDFRMGITLTNWWNGEIDKVTNLYIVTPKEIGLKGRGEDMYSCRGRRDYVFEASSCSEIGEEDDGCDEGIHNVFRMDSDVNKIGDIEDSETIYCGLNIQDPENLLGGVPLATKYFKVVVEYDYNIHKEVGIQVRGGNGVRTVLAEGACSKKCLDNDGCLCPDGCEIEKGYEIYKDMTCGGDGVRIVLAEGDCVTLCIDEDGCLCPDGCEIEKGYEINNGMNCGGNKVDELDELFAVEGCGDNVNWAAECKAACKRGQHTGIYCKDGRWTCTVDDGTKKNDPTYYPLDLCYMGT